jgi:hypothetical protein
MAFCKGRWSIGIWAGRGSSGAECRFDLGFGEMKKEWIVAYEDRELFTRYRYNMCD